MRFYNEQHKYYCGIDLHTRKMYVCILDQEGTVRTHRNIAAQPEPFRTLIQPYREDIVVAVECIFTWYWLADLCAGEHIPFVLGHALYMKAVHGGKTKNDKIDAHKIAVLLRGGTLPQAYVYPAQMRSKRDLLRRRMYFMRKRAELLGHIQNTNSQYNLPDFGKKIAYKGNRLDIADRFEDDSVHKSVEVDLELVGQYDKMLNDLESYLIRHTRIHNAKDYFLLQTVPGIGKILALVLLYEIQDITRFPRVQDFSSYARLVRPTKTSAGKSYGTSNKKIGNPHLKWAFSEAACLFIRESEQAKRYAHKLESRHGKPKALSILANRIGRSVYFMLKNGEVFEMDKFFKH